MPTTQKGQTPSKLPSSTGDGKRTTRKPNSSLEVPTPDHKKTQEFPALLDEWERLAVQVRAKYWGSRDAPYWGPASSYNQAKAKLEEVSRRALTPQLLGDVARKLGALHIKILPAFNDMLERNGPGPAELRAIPDDDKTKHNDSRVLWWTLEACAEHLGLDGRLRDGVPLTTALACALIRGVEMVDRMSPAKGQPPQAYVAAVIVLVKFLHNFLETIATVTCEADAVAVAGFVETWAKNCAGLHVPSALKLSLLESEMARSV